jgi:hypothetical protein
MLLHRKPSDALRVVEKTLIKKPSDADLLHLRGQCLEQLGNAPGVRILLRALPRPRRPTPHCSPPAAALPAGRRAQRAGAPGAPAQAPRGPPPPAGEARCPTHTHTHTPSRALPPAPQAFACYMSALTTDAAHVEPLKAVAALYKSRGMLPEALAAYERAREAAPEDEVRAAAPGRCRGTCGCPAAQRRGPAAAVGRPGGSELWPPAGCGGRCASCPGAAAASSCRHGARCCLCPARRSWRTAWRWC